MIRIGNKGDQARAVLAGVSGKAISGAVQPVLINGQGQLGTATRPAQAAGSDLASELERQRARNRSQDAEIGRQANQIAEQAKDIARLERKLMKLSH